jgi:protein TonB
METNKILNADILDLLFDGRNKDYGAYDLRKHYNGRLGRAIAVMGGVVIVLFCFSFVGKGRHVVAPLMIVDSVSLAAVHEPTPPPVIPPPVIAKAQPPVAMIRDVTMRIVPDDQVKKEEIPPENKDLENVKIGAVNTPGGNDVGLDAPSVAVNDGGTAILTKPDDNDDHIFRTVEIDASYPGGLPAWARFLHKNLNYPQDAMERGIQGPVMVQFIVDKEGNVSDVQVVSGPTDGGLAEEAIRVIKKSGKWVPAIQNGRNVKSYKRQPVIFQLTDQ